MKVKELIKILQNHNPELEIYTYDHNHQYVIPMSEPEINLQIGGLLIK